MESATEFARISVFFVIGVGIDSGNDSPSDVDDNIGWKCCCDVSGCELERAGFEQMQRSSLHKLWPHLDVAWLDVVHHNVVWKQAPDCIREVAHVCQDAAAASVVLEGLDQLFGLVDNSVLPGSACWKF